MNVPIISGDIDDEGYKPRFVRVSFYHFFLFFKVRNFSVIGWYDVGLYLWLYNIEVERIRIVCVILMNVKNRMCRNAFSNLFWKIKGFEDLKPFEGFEFNRIWKLATFEFQSLAFVIEMPRILMFPNLQNVTFSSKKLHVSCIQFIFVWKSQNLNDS